MNSYRRCWTAYEKNQLLKHHIPLDNLDQYKDMPVEYITGYVEFCDRDFSLTQSTLIPRIESEELVQVADNFLTRISDKHENLNVLDVGTGCGNIALSIFLQFPLDKSLLTVVASDVDPACIQQAELNLQRLIEKKQQAQFEFYQSDLLENIPPKKYQLIVANLPYVPSLLLRQVDNSVKYYEPNLALDGGEDGLDLVRKLIEQVPPFLHQDGLLIMEIDSRSPINRGSLMLTGDWNYKLLNDEWDKQRFLIVARMDDEQLDRIVSAIKTSYNR